MHTKEGKEKLPQVAKTFETLSLIRLICSAHDLVLVIPLPSLVKDASRRERWEKPLFVGMCQKILY